MIDRLIYMLKLKYTEVYINFIKAICGNSTPPFKIVLQLFALKEMCVNIQKIMSCKTKL